jgi:nitrogen regulatory protein P-II 1
MVKSAIAALEVTGLTVADVRGTGNSPETSAWTTVGAAPLPIRSRIEVVVSDLLVDEVVDAITRSGRTGEPNDGKIFIEDVADAVRIRTNERGADAV